MAARSEDLSSARALPLFSRSPEEEIRDAVIGMLPDVDSTPPGDPGEPTEGSIVKTIRPLEGKDLIRILPWFADPNTQRHIKPLPKLPADFSNSNQLMEAVRDIGNYYDNKGEPNKITPLVAVNEKDKPLAVVTIRWRADPWVPEGGHKRAGIERLVVNPRIRRKGIGDTLTSEAERMAFVDRKYPVIKAWVLTDETAQDLSAFIFFRDRGYKVDTGPRRHWKEYAEMRGIDDVGGDELWLVLTKEDWEKREVKRKRERRQQLRSTLTPNGETAK